MPADEKLCAAIGARARRFLLSDNGVASEVKSLILSQSALPLDVLALHRNFAEIVSQRSQPERRAVLLRQVEQLGERIRDPGYPSRMWMSIAFELIRGRRETKKGLAYNAFIFRKLKLN
jgi:hypothetical protein